MVTILLQETAPNVKKASPLTSLTPIKETVAVKERMQEAQVELLVEQLEQKCAVPVGESAKRLAVLDSSELKARGRYLMKAEQDEQIEACTDGRLTTTE